MSLLLIRYDEPMEASEITFLKQKEQKERKQFYKIIRVLMILCFICPFVGAWVKAGEGVENPFSYERYFFGVVFLSCFAGAGCYFAYYNNLRKIQSDIRKMTKTVESTRITRKQFVPLNKTFHFYLDSPTKLSIEVSEPDYQRMDKGDELNIEYTSHAKLYLGYF